NAGVFTTYGNVNAGGDIYMTDAGYGQPVSLVQSDGTVTARIVSIGSDVNAIQGFTNPTYEMDSGTLNANVLYVGRAEPATMEQNLGAASFLSVTLGVLNTGVG